MWWTDLNFFKLNLINNNYKSIELDGHSCKHWAKKLSSTSYFRVMISCHFNQQNEIQATGDCYLLSKDNVIVIYQWILLHFLSYSKYIFQNKGVWQGLVKEAKLSLNPYFFGWLESELAGCRSTLSMSKIKVRISETKFCSFSKTLVSA